MDNNCNGSVRKHSDLIRSLPTNARVVSKDQNMCKFITFNFSWYHTHRQQVLFELTQRGTHREMSKYLLSSEFAAMIYNISKVSKKCLRNGEPVNEMGFQMASYLAHSCPGD